MAVAWRVYPYNILNRSFSKTSIWSQGPTKSVLDSLVHFMIYGVSEARTLFYFSLVSGCGVVKPYPSKRLLATATTILNTTMTMTSEKECVLSCYYDNPGCLAVNVIRGDDDIICQMTTGLSNNSDMKEDSSSVVYITNRYRKRNTTPWQIWRVTEHFWI